MRKNKVILFVLIFIIILIIAYFIIKYYNKNNFKSESQQQTVVNKVNDLDEKRIFGFDTFIDVMLRLENKNFPNNITLASKNKSNKTQYTKFIEEAKKGNPTFLKDISDEHLEKLGDRFIIKLSKEQADKVIDNTMNFFKR